MEPGPSAPDETDILIVGGGIIGTATAFALSSRTGRAITLVEKDQIAAGATGDSSAILRHVYGDRTVYSRMAWLGHQFYRRFEAETGYELKTPDQRLILWGGEDVEHTEPPDHSYETLRELGYPTTRYEGEELPDEFPLFEFDNEIEYAVSDDAAGYTEGTTAANGFAKAAADNGADIVTGVDVDSIATDDGAVTGVETDEGFIGCQELVVAAGAWTHKLLATADVDVPVSPGREQVLLLDPPASLTEAEFESLPTTGRGSDRPDGTWWYFRADFGRSIYMGSHGRTELADPDHYRRNPDESRKLEAGNILDEFAPKLADSRLAGGFAGIYANTPDQGFIIDQVGPRGIYALIGAGHAFKHAPVIGQLAADLLLEGESELFDLGAFSVDRFDDRTPNQPLPDSNDPAELHLSESADR
jgi:glycine/D-amino acid oxidase-like deaminating enzyme